MGCTKIVIGNDIFFIDIRIDTSEYIYLCVSYFVNSTKDAEVGKFCNVFPCPVMSSTNIIAEKGIFNQSIPFYCSVFTPTLNIRLDELSHIKEIIQVLHIDLKVIHDEMIKVSDLRSTIRNSVAECIKSLD